MATKAKAKQKIKIVRREVSAVKTQETAPAVLPIPKTPAIIKKALPDDTKEFVHAGGRPPIITALVMQKLETAFSYGATDKEACFYADISERTLYNYQEKYPEFVERKEALKTNPILKAREAVMLNFLSNPQVAMRFLEAKLPEEFSTKQKHDHKHTIEIDFVGELEERARKYDDDNIIDVDPIKPSTPTDGAAVRAPNV